MDPKFYKELEQEANRAVVEFVNRLAPFSPEMERRTVLDISPGDGHNIRYLLLVGYHVVALKDEKADVGALYALNDVRDAYNEYEKLMAQQQKRPIDPKFTREYEIVHELPETRFDGIIAIHTFIDISPIKLKYLADYITDFTKPKGYLALTTRTTQPNPFPKWRDIPDWKTQYTGKEEKRRTESYDLARVIERLLRKPRK